MFHDVAHAMNKSAKTPIDVYVGLVTMRGNTASAASPSPQNEGFTFDIKLPSPTAYRRVPAVATTTRRRGPRRTSGSTRSATRQPQRRHPRSVSYTHLRAHETG